MIDVSRAKILEALETIKEVCTQTGSCSHCPLRDWNCECMLITQQPYTWKIASEDSSWRAFDD